MATSSGPNKGKETKTSHDKYREANVRYLNPKPTSCKIPSKVQISNALQAIFRAQRPGLGAVSLALIFCRLQGLQASSRAKH